MALVIDDRVRETSTVTGTSDATLLGAVTGFQAFSVIGNGNTTYYTISDQSGNNWEVGIGTFSSIGPTLARTTVLSSSAGGAKVSFPAGTKDVFVTYPSDKAVYLDESGNVQPALGTVNATTVDTTNLEVTNIKAKDGTSAGSIANSTGVVTLASSVLTTTDINGGTIDNTAIGGSTAAAGNFTTLGATGVATFSAGTVSAPAITTTGDTNTGIFFPAADTIAFSEGGVESMRIDSSGNVGINTTTPTNYGAGYRTLAINGTSSGALELQQNGTVNALLVADSSDLQVQAIGAKPIRLFTNGTERMRIDSSGNVGIGTSSPSTYGQVVAFGNGFAAACGAGTTSAKFEVFSNGQTNQQVTLSQGFGGLDNIGYLYNRANAAFVFGTNNTERMRITSAGDVAIGGTTTNSTKLYALGIVGSSSGYRWDGSSSGARGVVNTTSSLYAISGDGITYGYGVSTNNSGGLDIMANQANQDIRFYCGTNNASPSERMRIDSSGAVLIGRIGQINQEDFGVTTTDDIACSTNRASSTAYYPWIFYSNSTTVGYIFSTSTATTYATSSDYRLKENIAPMIGALGVVSQLKPVTYNWKVDGSASQGFIAHELQEVVPDCVTGEKDAVDKDGNPVYQGIDTSFLVATLTAAIQELKAELDSVKAELQTLKGN